MRVSNVTVRKRLLFVLLFGVIVFLIIDTRLGYVQFVMGEKLTSLAKDSGAGTCRLSRREARFWIGTV